MQDKYWLKKKEKVQVDSSDWSCTERGHDSLKEIVKYLPS